MMKSSLVLKGTEGHKVRSDRSFFGYLMSVDVHFPLSLFHFG